MGLDMYLTKRIYIGANYKHRNITGAISLEQNGKPITINLDRVSYVEEQVAYWRKANMIHNWFVQNCQDGNDDCQRSEVSFEQLEELYRLVEQVLKHRDTAKDTLPPVEGFFFGGDAVDEYYWQQMEETHTMLAKLILENELLTEEGTWDSYEYCASW